MYYSVDRITEELAVLQDYERRERIVPLEALPAGVHAGDILTEENGVFSVDDAETVSRRQKVLEMQRRLIRRGRKDN